MKDEQLVQELWDGRTDAEILRLAQHAIEDRHEIRRNGKHIPKHQQPNRLELVSPHSGERLTARQAEARPDHSPEFIEWPGFTPAGLLK